MRYIRDIFRSYAEFDAEGRHINGTDKQSNHNYGDAYESLFAITEEESLCNPIYSKDGTLVGRLCRYCGSDTSHWWYCKRLRIKMVMEIGVADGSCLLAWREVFPNATIVGMDIHHSDRAHGDRIEFNLGDQRKMWDCWKAANNRMFDIIIEDATHKLEDTLLTLLFLWPYVKPGGLYIIEEFENVQSLKPHIKAMWPFVSIVGTCGPHIQDEPLIVLRKPI